MTSTIKIPTKLALYAISALFLISVFISLVPGNAKAVSASDWKPGRIIDDAVFFNKDAMNPQQIQAFLNSKVPVCDTWHNWSGTVNGVWNAPPYTCLKDFTENGKSAAQIIWEAGQNHGINPQVLITTLQKETALVTDPWAAPWQYQRAMGYACPDTAACDSQYYGFTNQVHTAAWQFRRYVDYPDRYNFIDGVTRNIQWHPNSGCGSSPVFIETKGTAALYNYTPYQPNGAALNNLYGTGDGCSAYGNRNFWRIFNDWFGAGYVPNPNILISGAVNVVPRDPRVGQEGRVEYIVKNTSTANTDTGGLWVCTFMNGKPLGGGYNRKVLAPNESLMISMPYTFKEVGNLVVTACGDVPGGNGWTPNYPYGAWPDHMTRNFTVNQSPILISGAVNVVPRDPRVGQEGRVEYIVKNTSTANTDTGGLWVCTFMNGKPLGGGYNRKVLAPNESLMISMPYTFKEVGNLVVTACGDVPGGNGWTPNYPYGAWPDHMTRNFTVNQSPILISGAVNVVPRDPRVGQEGRVEYIVKNTSTANTDTGGLWVCTFMNGKPLGGGYNRKVLAPNESLMISMPYTFKEVGNLVVTACGDVPGGNGWTPNYPYGAWPDHMTRNFTVNI